MQFRYVEENLRESFRVLARGRERAGVLELPGVSIASLGVSFQMFNAAFLSEPVESPRQLEQRLETASSYFAERGMPWAAWICEDWLSQTVRRRVSRVCEGLGLRITAEMPGMTTVQLERPVRELPHLEVHRVENGKVLDDFCGLGSTCFHVPIHWFREVFDASLADRPFVSWVGYEGGVPVATAATVRSAGSVGLYNVATTPKARQKGYGEAITRYALEAAQREADVDRAVLQATSQGFPLYQRLGFESVTRILVYNSLR